MEIHLVPAGPTYLQVFFHERDTFITYILRVIKYSSIHRLQLVFMDALISPIGLICMSTLNITHINRSERDVVDLKCC